MYANHVSYFFIPKDYGKTILQRVKKSIESAIQEEFESFVSEMEVYKNGTRKIKPKTYFGRIGLSIPRTR